MDVRLVLSLIEIGTPDPATPAPLAARVAYQTIDPVSGYSVVGSGQVVEAIALPVDRRLWKRVLVDAVLSDAAQRGWAVKKVIWAGTPTFSAERVK